MWVDLTPPLPSLPRPAGTAAVGDTTMKPGPRVISRVSTPHRRSPPGKGTRLPPLEAAAFGKPVAVLRWGGSLDTVVEGETGLYFDPPEPRAIAASLRRLLDESWSMQTLHAQARRFDETRFIQRLQELALEEMRAA